jgi:hypothetical protein
MGPWDLWGPKQWLWPLTRQVWAPLAQPDTVQIVKLGIQVDSSVKNEGSKNSDLALPRNWVYRPKKPYCWLGKRMISQWIRIYDFRICCNPSFDNGHASKLEKQR